MSCNLFSLDIGVYIFVLEKPALIQIVHAVQILDQFNLGRAEGESLTALGPPAAAANGDEKIRDAIPSGRAGSFGIE